MKLSSKSKQKLLQHSVLAALGFGVMANFVLFGHYPGLSYTLFIILVVGFINYIMLKKVGRLSNSLIVYSLYIAFFATMLMVRARGVWLH